MMKVASLCFEVCYPQRNALSVKKSKAKTGKIRHVSQDTRHLHEIPWGKGLWDTIRSSSGSSPRRKSPLPLCAIGSRKASFFPFQIEPFVPYFGAHLAFLSSLWPPLRLPANLHLKLETSPAWQMTLTRPVHRQKWPVNYAAFPMIACPGTLLQWSNTITQFKFEKR